MRHGFDKIGLFLGRCMLYPQIKVIRVVIVTEVHIMNKIQSSQNRVNNGLNLSKHFE